MPPGLRICILLLLFTTASSAAPQLRLSTAAVGPLYVTPGAAISPPVIYAFNIGDGALNLSISSSGPWLRGTVGAPVACPAAQATVCIPIQIGVSADNLSQGTYTEALTIADPQAIDAPQTVTVTVQVNGAIELYVTPAGGPMSTASAVVYTRGPVQSSVSTSDGGNWLTFIEDAANSNQAFSSYKLSAAAQPGQSGNYSGTVVLSGSDNRTIAVNLHVTSQPILQIAPVSIQQLPSTLTFQTLGLGTLSIARAGVRLSLPGFGSFFYSVSADVVSPSAVLLSLASSKPFNPFPFQGKQNATLQLESNAANSASPVPLRLNLTTPSGPAVSFGGVVDSAALIPGMPVASGSLATVFGTGLSKSGGASATGVPLPTMLNGVQILVNGMPAPILYADGTQARFQVPFGLTAGTMLVQPVVDGQPGNIISALVDSIAPRLYPLKTSPLHRGDVVTLYALGLGPVSPPVDAGSSAPASEPLARITNDARVYFGDVASTTPSYAGLAPNFVGLYQVNVTIPPDAPTGKVPVMLDIAGHKSNSIELTIDSPTAATAIPVRRSPAFFLSLRSTNNPPR